MADRYLHFTATGPGRFLTRRLGLPSPAALRRWSPERPALEGPVLHLAAGASSLALPDVGLKAAAPGERPAGVVLDASALATVDELAELHRLSHPVVRSVAQGGRVVVLGAAVSATDHHQAAAQQALEGFVRSLGKEIGGGRTVNLVRVRGDAAGLESTLRFLLSPRSAYVSGQVVEVGGGQAVGGGGRGVVEGGGGGAVPPFDPDRPLAGRTALVTGAARGIGAAVAATLERDGARVIGLDVTGADVDADITAPDAARVIADAAGDGGLDVLVHNAGITRDRRLANMAAERWSSVLDVNLGSVLRTTDALLADGTLRRGGAIVATASIAGIAGNTGQTNYAASKAGVIGFVRALGAGCATGHGVRVNAVAPGFIETKMTAAVPLLIREAGRRMNSLGQGGLPVDVAEAVAWLASPGAAGVNGQVVRVCGQSLLGA
ncbi:3-oxoacyl-ACP reductase [Streptomyces sp. NPDC050504]|uniref:3-oxoacyl-ACP reductase n=1 Tax=Streptomyces sp. NPDC050504 TaxID=3365618 RepID=UPI00379129E4